MIGKTNLQGWCRVETNPEGWVKVGTNLEGWARVGTNLVSCKQFQDVVRLFAFLKEICLILNIMISIQPF